jgi:hypothetical protein
MYTNNTYQNLSRFVVHSTFFTNHGGEEAIIHAQEGFWPSSTQEQQPIVDVPADSTGMLLRVSREPEIVGDASLSNSNEMEIDPSIPSVAANQCRSS